MSTTRKGLGRGAFVSTSLCALLRGDSQQKDEKAWEVLRKVQETYAGAIAYDLDCVEKKRSDLDVNDPHSFFWSIRMACLEPHHFFYQQPLPETPRDKPERIICGDGVSVFQFSAVHNKEYIEEVYSDSHVAARKTLGGDAYLRFHLDYLECFRKVVDRKQDSPRFLGMKTRKIFERTVECEVVDTFPLDRFGVKATETLWVEPGTNRVLLSNRRGWIVERGVGTRAGTRMPLMIDRFYRWRVLGQEISRDVFRFVPPEGARFVEKFTRLPPRFISLPSM